jgi:hypothetical protein
MGVYDLAHSRVFHTIPGSGCRIFWWLSTTPQSVLGFSAQRLDHRIAVTPFVAAATLTFLSSSSASSNYVG